MTPTQREAALRLADALPGGQLYLRPWAEEAAALLRKLAVEPEPNPFVGTMAEQLLQVIAGIWTEHPDYSLRQTLEALNALMLPAEPVQEPVATLHDDGCFTWKRDEFRRLYDRQRAGWRMDVYAHPPQQRKPQGEPVAWVYEHDGMIYGDSNQPIITTARWPSPVKEPYTETPLYAAPQQRQPLSDEQIDRLDTQAIHGGPDSQYAFRFARLIERAILGEAP